MNALDFTQTTSLSAEGKDVKYLGINGNLAWSKVDGDANLSAYMTGGATNMSYIGSGTRTEDTYICPNGVVYTYGWSPEYYTIAPEFAGADAGNKRPFAVSPHLMATAAHYGDTIQLGSLTIGTGTNQSTVNRIGHENLAAWAKASGKWSEEYIDRLNIGDIEMVKLDKTDDAIKDSVLPCFVDNLKLQALFNRKSLSGIAGLNCPKQTFLDSSAQQAAMSMPIIFGSKTSTGLMRWSVSNLLSASIPDGEFVDEQGNITSWKDGFDRFPNTYLGTTGDSGRPVYIHYSQNGNTKFVVISHCQAVEVPAFGATPPYFMTGPDYTLAYPILKEYVKEYEGTDALKTITL